MIDDWHGPALQVLCSTTHLSIFGGVFEVFVGDIAQVLRCSTASLVFSAEGLGRLGVDSWDDGSCQQIKCCSELSGRTDCESTGNAKSKSYQPEVEAGLCASSSRL